MAVRQATEWDLPAVIQLSLAYAEEADHHDNFTFDPELAALHGITAVRDPNSCFLVSVYEGKVVGFLWAILTTLPWSRTPIALDNILYVSPDYRGKQGMYLIRAYEKWAQECGAVEVNVSIASGITNERTESLYERLGYTKVGTSYRKEIPNGE